MNIQKKDKNAIIVNLFGGPGCGKSTLAAKIFTILKEKNIECEIAYEYVKEKVWDKSYNVMDDTIYIFAKQHHRIWRLLNQVDVIITDAPILNPIIYDIESNKDLKNLIINQFNKFNNLNFFINRSTIYSENGRMQKLKDAEQIDKDLIKLLTNNNIEFSFVEKENIDEIITKIIQKLNK